ncbi:MAG: phage tail tape measure protein [Lysobacteraceae bacterium]
MADELKIEVILAAFDRATTPFRKVTNEARSTTVALRANQTELKSLKRLQQDVSGYRVQERALSASSAKVVAQQRALRTLQGQYNSLDAPTKKQTAELKRQTAALAKLQTETDDQRRSLEAARAKMEAAGISTAKLAVHERELERRIQSTNQGIDRQRSKLDQLAQTNRRLQQAQGALARSQATASQAGSMGASAGAGAVVAGGAALAPVVAFARQQAAAAQLQASMMAADGKVSAEYARIDALAKSLGNRLPGNTADFYEMFTMLRRQGMSSQVILGGLGEATAYLGAQLRIPYTEAAQFSAKLQDATRTGERDMLALSDVIQRTFYLGVDQNNMLQGFSKLSPALTTIRMHGLQAAEALAPLLVMADQAGMVGEAAGNAYRKVFQYSLDIKKLGKANALLSGTGVQLDFSNGKGEFGGIEKMFSQLQQLKGINTQDRLAVISKLFGDDAETLQVVSLLIDKGIGGYRETQQKMAAQAGLQQRVNSQLGTVASLWESATGTFQNVQAAAGETVRPETENLMKVMSGAGERMQAWIRANPELTAGLLKVAIGGAAVMAVVSGVGLTVSAVLGPLAMAKYAVTTLGLRFGPLMGQIMPLARNALPMLMQGARLLLPLLGGISAPVLLVGAAIAGVALLIWKYWGPIKAFMSGVFQGIGEAAGPVMDQLSKALEPLRPVWDWFAGILGDVWKWVKELVTPFNATNEQLQNATNYGRIAGKVLGTVLVTPLKTTISVVSTLWRWLKVAFEYSPLGMIVNNWTAITTFLGGLWEQMKTIGGQIVQGLVDGLKAGFPLVSAVMGKLAGLLPQTTNKALEVRSPSRVFARIGDYTMQGLAGGLQRSAGLPVAALGMVQTNLRRIAAGAALGAATAPAIAIDSRPALARTQAPAAAAAGLQIEHLHIHVGPGMDGQAIGAEVRRQVEALMREKQARGRSALTDYGN